MTTAVAAAAGPVYTRAMLLEHIHDLNPNDFLDLQEVDTPTLLAGQANTAAFLASLGADDAELITEDQRSLARDAFAAVTNPNTTQGVANAAVIKLRVPAAVRHLAGMLSQYDWDFVEQAKEIRGYVVAKVMEETSSPDPRIRLKALKLLGDVTEVGAFTTRTEIVKPGATEDELQQRIRAKLKAMLPKVIEIETTTPRMENENAPQG